MSGLGFGEQPRWHENRLWFSDWGTQEVIAVDLGGNSEVILRGQSFPWCVDWLPDGRLLVVAARDGLLLRREPDGSLVTHGDVRRRFPSRGNELVVDARGNAYLNGDGFDLMAGEPFAPGVIALVRPDGSARQVADGLCVPRRHAGHARRLDADRLRVLRQAAYRFRDRGRRQPVQPPGLGRSRRRRPRRHLRRRRERGLVRGRPQQALCARS